MASGAWQLIYRRWFPVFCALNLPFGFVTEEVRDVSLFLPEYVVLSLCFPGRVIWIYFSGTQTHVFLLGVLFLSLVSGLGLTNFFLSENSVFLDSGSPIDLDIFLWDTVCLFLVMVGDEGFGDHDF